MEKIVVSEPEKSSGKQEIPSSPPGYFSDDDEEEYQDPDDEDYGLSTDDDSDNHEKVPSGHRKPDNGSMFLVFWSSLVLLLARCMKCGCKAMVDNVIVRGTQLMVKVVCDAGHHYSWKSQPQRGRTQYALANVRLSQEHSCPKGHFQGFKKYSNSPKLHAQVISVSNAVDTYHIIINPVMSH